MSNTEPTSLRAYFAANAPTEIPKWFKPDLDRVLPLPPAPEVPLEIKVAVKEAGTSIFLDKEGLPDVYLPVEVFNDDMRQLFQSYRADYQAWAKKAAEIDQKRTEYPYFAWRWYYAEQMIKANPVKAGLVL